MAPEVPIDLAALVAAGLYQPAEPVPADELHAAPGVARTWNPDDGTYRVVRLVRAPLIRRIGTRAFRRPRQHRRTRFAVTRAGPDGSPGSPRHSWTAVLDAALASFERSFGGSA